MSNDNNSSPCLLIPFVILSISVIAFLGWQSKVISDQRTSVTTAKSKLEETYTNTLPKMEEAIAQSKKSKDGLEKLALDIIELAKTDPDAKAIAAKYVQAQKGAASPAPSDKK